MTLIRFSQTKKKFGGGTPRFNLSSALIFLVGIGQFKTNKIFNFSSVGELGIMIDVSQAFIVVRGFVAELVVVVSEFGKHTMYEKGRRKI
jgi:hypothetical protein